MNYLSPIVAALTTWVLILILLRSRAAHKVQDIPNERSLHQTPIPRIGGLALVVGLFAGWAFQLRSLPWWIALPLLSLFLISIVDDMRGLSVRYRLLVHLLAAALLVYGMGIFAQGMVLGAAMFLLVVWMINLYNFMDGSDGLSGGMALIGFSVYGIAAMHGNYVPFALLNFAVAAAALGFLFFNFYPAKIFMGDAGSIPLGFLAAAMGMWGWQINLWSVWFPLLVFSPFVVDATVTLCKRGLRGEKIWQAHREHYYQRLVQLGFGHRNTAIAEYLLMAGAGGSAYLSLRYPEFAIPLLLAWSAIFLTLMLLLEYYWKNRKNA